MILNIGNQDFELKTTLGVATKIEEGTKRTITEVMSELYKSSTVKDMLTLLKSALTEKSDPGTFESVVLESMDFTFHLEVHPMNRSRKFQIFRRALSTRTR